MPQKSARLQNHELFGEPDLDVLLSDPVMLTLWRADGIDPDEARRLFAHTTAMLRRARRSRRERLAERADERITAERIAAERIAAAASFAIN